MYLSFEGKYIFYFVNEVCYEENKGMAKPIH